MKINVFVRCPKCKKRHPSKTRGGVQKAACPDHPTATPSWLVEQSSTIAGKTKRSYSTFRTQAEADVEKTRLEAVAAGLVTTGGEPSNVPFATALSEWVESQSEELSWNSLDSYRRTAKKIAKHPIGRIPVGMVTKTDLRSLYGEWIRQYRPATVRQYASTIAGCFAELQTQGITRTNPAHKTLRISKDADSEPQGVKSWTAGQTARFIEEATGDPLYALWRLLLATGMRRGEALGIEIQDVNLDDRTIEIRQQIHAVSANGEIRMGRPKTGKTRQAHFDEATGKLLARQTTTTIEAKLASRGWHDGHQFVFTQGAGLPWNPATITSRFRKLTDRLGLPRIGPHGLRHTAATLLIEAGADIVEVRDHLGHASIQTTVATYTHRSGDARGATADLLGTVLSTG